MGTEVYRVRSYVSFVGDQLLVRFVVVSMPEVEPSPMSN
jgi:hypothetical protein